MFKNSFITQNKANCFYVKKTNWLKLFQEHEKRSMC